MFDAPYQVPPAAGCPRCCPPASGARRHGGRLGLAALAAWGCTGSRGAVGRRAAGKPARRVRREGRISVQLRPLCRVAEGMLAQDSDPFVNGFCGPDPFGTLLDAIALDRGSKSDGLWCGDSVRRKITKSLASSF